MPTHEIEFPFITITICGFIRRQQKAKWFFCSWHILSIFSTVSHSTILHINFNIHYMSFHIHIHIAYFEYTLGSNWKLKNWWKFIRRLLYLIVLSSEFWLTLNVSITNNQITLQRFQLIRSNNKNGAITITAVDKCNQNNNIRLFIMLCSKRNCIWFEKYAKKTRNWFKLFDKKLFSFI